MKRAQIQLDDETYSALRQRAFEVRQSMSAVVRDTLAAALNVKRAKARTVGTFRFVASGRSLNRSGQPVSERHDAALAESFAPARPRRR